MSHFRAIWTFCCLMVVTCRLMAVETIIVGDVYSAQTGEPIPNASVYFRGSKVGTSTNEEGAFCLRVDLNATLKLKVSAVGFRPQLFEISAGNHVGLQVLLEERTHTLEEVMVVPGANPALALMDSVRRYRPERSTQPSDCDVQEQCYLSHISARHLRHRLWRSMREYMVEGEDSTLLLPVPVSLVSELGVSVPEHLDFYESVMPFASTSFLSPVSGSGRAYYQYFLIDSLCADSGKQYLVDFRPRNAFDPLLSGRLTIDSASYRLTQVTADLPYRANLNYLSSLRYSACYQQGCMVSDSMQVVYDMNALRRDTANHLFPSLLLIRSSQLSLPVLASESTPAVVSPTAASAYAGDVSAPEVPLPPLFRFAYWLSYMVHTGYISTGSWLDVGLMQEILRYSDYEGLHLGLPFRTNERLFPHVSLEGYVAYGFRDRGVKWKAQVSALLPTDRRQLLSAYVWDRYVYEDVNELTGLARENSFLYNNLSFVSELTTGLLPLNRLPFHHAVRRREARVGWESDWCASSGARPSVETRLSFSLAQQDIRPSLRGNLYRDAEFFRFATLQGVVRLGWGERTADWFTVRKHIYSRYPTLFVGGKMGSYSALSESLPGHLFGQLQLTLRQDIPLGVAGHLLYTAEAGMVLGRVPDALGCFIQGNNGYVFDPYRFTLLGDGQFATRRYLALQSYWNGGGILFNRIPGVRYLRLRELLEAKLVWGDGALFTPYVEYGVGIGNILGFAELWCIGRATNPADLSSAGVPWVSCRFRLHIGM